MTFCDFAPVGDRWECVACSRRVKRTRRETPPIADCSGEGGGGCGKGLVFNDLSAGPCIHRGPLVAIERCQMCSDRDNPVETFLCLPDDGCAGPAPVVSERQWSHAQTLNRRRENCGWCERYVAAPALVSLSTAALPADSAFRSA